MRNLFRMSALCISLAAGVAQAAEYLVRFDSIGQEQERFISNNGGTLTLVSREGVLFKWVTNHEKASEVANWEPSVRYVQPNFTIRLLQNPSLEANREAIANALAFMDPMDMGDIFGETPADNPDIPPAPGRASGADPMLTDDWGIQSIGTPTTWTRNAGKGIIVAVTDSGVDYTHEDLVANMWRNTKEIPDNGIDDDKNGYVDDIVGWDFAMDDNKPYDMTVDFFSLIFGGGNPGHGTHVSGVIGATKDNGKGVAGVAPNAQIMGCRFITEKGSGTTESAIKAIDYAVANGAKVINASWGGEKGDEDDTALIESIQRAEKAGVIFVAAAGNGRNGVGYDNDNDPKPSIPATLNLPNIVSVAAIDVNDGLGAFSNFGNRTVRLGAPGVKILSTVPGDRYQDTVIDIPFLGMTAHWDGTSMASPHVAGAFATAWSDNPTFTYQQIIDLVLKNTKPIAALNGKTVTGGRLELRQLR
ncbi:S8 family serine peptidase [bacterium]|nr:S8 family serine peptidase [bacterium]